MYFPLEFETLLALQAGHVEVGSDDKQSIALKASDQNVEIVGKNGLQILTFSRSLQTGKMSSSRTAAGKRQTREMSGHVILSAFRGKKIRGA